MWQVFREHHYLNTKRLGAGVRCYVAKYGDKPVAFIAILRIHMQTNYYHVSRLVVLPDYQGIGIGKRLMTFMAEYHRKYGLPIPFRIITSNPQLARGLTNWRVKRFGHGSLGRSDTRINRGLFKASSRRRLTVTLEYVPKMGVPKP
jgi:GNAT superfamily N-acetyltransferase